MMRLSGACWTRAMVFTGLLSFAAPGTADAQPALDAALGVGFGAVEERFGIGALLGPAVRLGPIVGAVLGDMTLVGGDEDPRYRLERFDNGTEVCRDLTNGRFAKKDLCAPALDALFGLMLDLNLVLFASPAVIIGGGYRLGDGDGPYGTIGFEEYPWFFRFSIGGVHFSHLLIGVNL